MTEVITLLADRLDTPTGKIHLLADRAGNLRALDWDDHSERLHKLLERHYGKAGYRLEAARDPHGFASALAAYFAGRLDAIEGLPVATNGSAFQREVWRELRRIPCGATISYGALAARIGRPDAVRAVGLANGANPIGIVVPCHRVIGANGRLTGYGGGLPRKAWLLDHERPCPAQLDLAPAGKFA
jgi:methylated-DNA-[protein]-cysteine S-methyltransferase